MLEQTVLPKLAAAITRSFAVEVGRSDPDAGALRYIFDFGDFSMIDGVAPIADDAEFRQRHRNPVHVGGNEFSGETLINDISRLTSRLISGSDPRRCSKCNYLLAYLEASQLQTPADPAHSRKLSFFCTLPKLNSTLNWGRRAPGNAPYAASLPLVSQTVP